jgi:UDP-3-O-[3-hydroxymyristoyl] glucosamine N-acyltransferase
MPLTICVAMSDPVFFPRIAAITLADIASMAGVALPDGCDPQMLITGLAPLETAGPSDLAYMDNPRYGDALAATRAGVCLTTTRFAKRIPSTSVALVTRDPYRVFAALLARLYPSAMRPGSMFGTNGVSPGAQVHPEARLEQNVIIDPGAVIGPGAEIGSGTIIAANVVIGPQVRIGRQSSIGPGASISNALLGNRVIVHAGVRIGQDGFGFAMGSSGHLKVPQIGRVIIQDDVEIGANTTIDRGASRDTVIGEGTKIDNLVQIGHNAVIGRHCVIVSQVAIAGSTTLEDFVAIGGKVGIVGHVTIGMGAQIAASSNVAGDVPPGARWGGTPARPMQEWFREMTLLKNLAAKGRKRPSGGDDEQGDAG